MAPRYPSLYESSAATSSSSSSSCYSSSYSSTDYPILDSTLEFKPRLDLWASQTAYDAWTKPQTPSVNNNTKTSKRVRFAPLIKSSSKAHTSLSEYSQEEIQDCWFTRQEFRDMRAERQHVIESASSEDDLTQEWGLETSHNHSIYYEIRQAQMAVLEEQEDQLRWDGYLNVDILSARYMAYTAASKDRAYSIAEQHAKGAAAL